MSLPILRLLFAAILPVSALAAVAAACSPLGAFNTLAPKDGGVRLAAEGLAYGPDRRQRLDVYVPTSGRGPHPVIVFAYGGSWSSGDRGQYAFVGRALAARGFVTVVFDYRLVPAVRFPAFVEDGAAAVRFVEQRIGDYGGDGRRIVLAGHSAGAYIVAMLGVEPRFLQEAGADPQAVRGVVGLAGPYDFYPFDVDASRKAFGAYPEPEKTQPVNLVRGGLPPFLLATGSADDTVRPRNTTALAAALRGKGVDARVETYPGVTHAGILLALSLPFRGKAPALDDLTAFARAVTR